MPTLAVIGGGPAGLMAAEVARAAGIEVELYDAMGSVGRKLLLAGKGGLNLTHAEPPADFIRRYRDRQAQVGPWLAAFDAQALRDWARGLGVETFVGSSGRVFPSDLKAAPLLRGWLRRLRAAGVRFHMHHRWVGWCDTGALRFSTPDGERDVDADAVVLALGGASWPQLGSDGAWLSWFAAAGIDVAPLAPSNCGFDVAWTEHFSARYAGQPVKPVVAKLVDAQGGEHRQQGELMISADGVEGGLIYALSAPLRETIAATGSAELRLDLVPGRSLERLREDLARPRKGRSFSEHLRRDAGLSGVRAGLVFERLPKDVQSDASLLAAGLKDLALRLERPRPIAEAISSAGGLRFTAVDERLMLRTHPGVFCAGEMLDWDAPTGGYLLTAAFASGRVAGLGAVDWLSRRS